MTAVSYIASLLISIAALLITGDLHLDKTSLIAVLGGSTVFWSIQQGVYKILSDTPLGSGILWVDNRSTPTPAPLPAPKPATPAPPQSNVNKKV